MVWRVLSTLLIILFQLMVFSSVESRYKNAFNECNQSAFFTWVSEGYLPELSSTIPNQLSFALVIERF